MELSRRTTRLLHDEHVAALALLDRLDGLLARHRPGTPADAADSGVGRLLGDLVVHLETESGRHFDFEEEHLFPRLREFGDGFIADLLGQEHTAIRPLAARLAALAREARGGAFSPESWAEFHRLGVELVERQMAHIQKEEMGLLPLLDDLLEEQADADLAATYAMDA
jgi:hemerythrin-like domain-containing protein